MLGSAGVDTDGPGTAPRANAKWLTSSVVDDAASVLAAVVDEAQHRDPTPRPHRCTWVGFVDGRAHLEACGARPLKENSDLDPSAAPAEWGLAAHLTVLAYAQGPPVPAAERDDGGA